LLHRTATPSPPALRQLGRRTHDRLHHYGYVVIRSTRGDLEQLTLTLREKRCVTLDDRAQHAIARTEVVMQRAPVPLPGLARNLDKRRVKNAILGEGTSSGIEELLSRVRTIRWHAADVTFRSSAPDMLLREHPRVARYIRTASRGTPCGSTRWRSHRPVPVRDRVDASLMQPY
jgi:hypothetical protein